MKTDNITFRCLTFLLLVASTVAQASSLDVTVKKIEAAEGAMTVALYDRAQDFKAMSSGTYSAISQAVTNNTMRFSFHDLQPGRYALFIHHDRNRNNQMDTHIDGTPAEGYAYSNAVGQLRVPTFKEASFDVTEENIAVTLKLINY